MHSISSVHDNLPLWMFVSSYSLSKLVSRSSKESSNLHTTTLLADSSRVLFEVLLSVDPDSTVEPIAVEARMQSEDYASVRASFLKKGLRLVPV
jgi:hypothetical protein